MPPRPFSAFSLPRRPHAGQLVRGRSTQPGAADGHASSSSATGSFRPTSKPTVRSRTPVRRRPTFGASSGDLLPGREPQRRERASGSGRALPANVSTSGNLQQRASPTEDQPENGNGHHNEKLLLPLLHLQPHVTIFAKMKADHDNSFRLGGANPQHRDRQEVVAAHSFGPRATAGRATTGTKNLARHVPHPHVPAGRPVPHQLGRHRDPQFPGAQLHEAVHPGPQSVSRDAHHRQHPLEYDPSTDGGTASQ